MTTHQIPVADTASSPPGSDVNVSMRNLGRFGKVGLLLEHDRDRSRRWHMPRFLSRLRTRTGGKEMLVGWWDWAVTFTWVPVGERGSGPR